MSWSNLIGYTVTNRQDLNNFGGFGQQGGGYNDSLIRKLVQYLIRPRI